MAVLASLARRLGGKPWFALLGRALMPLDRLVGTVSKGRLVAFGLDELPSLMLTTTGRSSGKPRTTPLLFIADGDAFVVIGSNWGKAHHPAWSGNLLANPRAFVTLGGQRIPVVARLAAGAERTRLRELLLDMWPAYAEYERRAPHRTLRVFRLEHD